MHACPAHGSALKVCSAHLADAHPTEWYAHQQARRAARTRALDVPATGHGVQTQSLHAGAGARVVGSERTPVSRAHLRTQTLTAHRAGRTRS